MCTVSWLHTRDGYELFCNRDEKRSRAPGAGPEIREREGVRFVAPVDRAAGGAWIGANEMGVAMCLLNGARPGRRSAEYVSRGLLIPELIGARSAAEAAERAMSLDLARFAPFTLAILEARRRAVAVEWDGVERSLVEDALDRAPLVSSSHDGEGVRSRRVAEWRRIARQLDEESLFAFHSSHAGGPSAYSTCMHRRDAETVSFSRVRVTGSRVEFLYHPGAPCRRAVSQVQTLPRLR